MTAPRGSIGDLRRKAFCRKNLPMTVERERRRSLDQRLAFAAAITGVIVLVELTGGILANSLGLLSDAGHAFTDTLALLLAIIGVRQARRMSTPGMTFGYHRVAILTSLINGTLVLLMAGVIVVEALRRFQDPQPVQGLIMFSLAFVGLAANVAMALLLHPFQAENPSVRGAFWNVMGDLLSSMAVIMGGIFITLFGALWVDPLAGFVVAGVIAFAAIRIIREALQVFLEASPRHLSATEVESTIQSIPEIKGIHDLHIWSIAPQMDALSCHLQIDEISMHDANRVRQRVMTVLRERYDITHSTLQLECQHAGPGDLYCSVIVSRSNVASGGHGPSH